MEAVTSFPYIAEQIFGDLDSRSLERSKNVCRAWKQFIEDPNHKLFWIQMIEEVEGQFEDWPIVTLKKFISGPQPKWIYLGMRELRDFVAKLYSFNSNLAYINELYLEKYIELKVELNGKCHGSPAIHWVCLYLDILDSDHGFKIINLLLQNSVPLKLDLDAVDDFCGFTAFQLFCMIGNVKIVGIMIEEALNAKNCRFDLKAMDKKGLTAFQLAQNLNLPGQVLVVDLIKRKLPPGTY